MKRTGVVFDERMKKHFNMWDSTHPEVPDRIQRPYDKLKEYGPDSLNVVRKLLFDKHDHFVRLVNGLRLLDFYVC